MPRTQTVSARVDSSLNSKADKILLALNTATLKAIKDADARRNFKTFKTTKALFKDLGI